MDAITLAIIVFCVVALVLALALALGAAAKSADEGWERSGLMGVLSTLRSPSGKPFFASSKSVEEFEDVLESTRTERDSDA